jgi:hypothetical protein
MTQIDQELKICKEKFSEKRGNDRYEARKLEGKPVEDTDYKKHHC